MAKIKLDEHVNYEEVMEALLREFGDEYQLTNFVTKNILGTEIEKTRHLKITGRGGAGARVVVKHPRKGGTIITVAPDVYNGVINFLEWIPILGEVFALFGMWALLPFTFKHKKKVKAYIDTNPWEMNPSQRASPESSQYVDTSATFTTAVADSLAVPLPLPLSPPPLPLPLSPPPPLPLPLSPPPPPLPLPLSPTPPLPPPLPPPLHPITQANDDSKTTQNPSEPPEDMPGQIGSDGLERIEYPFGAKIWYHRVRGSTMWIPSESK